jgi:WD40 repeat protein
VLGVGSWGGEEENIITYVVGSAACGRSTGLTLLRHGRDNKLLVWQLREADEKTFSRELPIDDASTARKQPWLLHSLDVNALNFCSFAMCHTPSSSPSEGDVSPSEHAAQPSILVAVPGVQDGLISITSLPAATRFATIPPPKDTSTGMLMAVSLHYPKNTISPLVAAGYEGGHVALWRYNAKSSKWETIYLHKSHSQPVLSLETAPGMGCFFSSSADAIVARHPLGEIGVETKIMQTKHAGQQSLSVRGDGKIFATAGWDGRVRVYATKGMKELAVLKWHKEGCYATAFADVLETQNEVDDDGPVTGRELTVTQQRAHKTQSTHWLAAGSKDGKVSLWDIY